MIGVFDSGFGGLTVLKEFLKFLPEYDYVYLGDNARSPYGNRSHETLKKFTEQGIRFLFDKGCPLIIIACNTASAQVLRELQEELLRQPNITDKKILGVIKPIAEAAVRSTRNRHIGVVGTRSTINSKSYEIELHSLKPEVRVFSQACPLLVPLIEEGWLHKPETKMILKKYLRPIKSCNIDTLILGCTHYPFLMKEFQRIMGKKVRVPNPGEIVAKSLQDYLQRHQEIEKLLSKKGTRTFLTTDNPERFKEIGKNLLKIDIRNVEKVELN